MVAQWLPPAHAAPLPLASLRHDVEAFKPASRQHESSSMPRKSDLRTIFQPIVPHSHYSMSLSQTAQSIQVLIWTERGCWTDWGPDGGWSLEKKAQSQQGNQPDLIVVKNWDSRTTLGLRVGNWTTLHGLRGVACTQNSTKLDTISTSRLSHSKMLS